MTIELDNKLTQIAADVLAAQALASGLEVPTTCPAPLDNVPPLVTVNLPQTVNENTVVNVLGNVIDSDGTYSSSWSQLSGTPVTIVEDGLDNMSFTAPEVTSDEVLTFRLTATDNDMAVSSADTSVTISDVIALPPPATYEGFGASATGGTTPYDVNTLADSGAGSLRDAVSVSGRNITFSVSGTITLLSAIIVTTSNLTIDGLSSPNGIDIEGFGIYIEGNGTDDTQATNGIIQGLRIQNTFEDGIRFWKNANNWVCTRNSVINAGDGSIDVVENAHNVTVSWNFMSISASGSTLQSYNAHQVSHHHNFYFGSGRRNPAIYNTAPVYSSGTAVMPHADVQFNVAWNYGWGMRALTGIYVNFMNNLYKNNPSISANSSYLINKTDFGYLEGNVAIMDIRTGNQWDTNAAITSTNSNSKGTKHSAPAITGTDRLVEWASIITTAGTGRPDNAIEAAARIWAPLPTQADINQAWNDG